MEQTISKSPGHTLNLDEVTDLILKYAHYWDREALKQAIALHEKYKTLLVVYDNDKIAGVCRWNILPSGKVAHILDIVIEEKYRGTGLLQRMLLRGLEMYPDVKDLMFERMYPSNNAKKPMKRIPVKDFFREYKGV